MNGNQMSFRDVWDYVGPLVGVCLGGTIGWLAQRLQWIKNNKKLEYRELLTALLKAYNAAQLTYSNGAGHWAPGVLQSYTDDIYAAGVVLENRLFIRKELEKLDLKNRWERALGGLRSTHNHQTFQDEFNKIKLDVLKAARG